MGKIILLIKNTLKVTFRRKGSIFIYLLLPMAGVLLSTLIYSGAGHQAVRIGIVDRDGSSISGDTMEMIEGMKGYIVQSVEEDSLKELLVNGRLDAAVIIPEGYGEGIYSHEAEKIEIVSIKGRDTTAWIENYINLHTRNLMDLSLASKGDGEAFERMYQKYRESNLKLTEIKQEDRQTGKNMTVTSLGFLIMFVMLGAGMTSQLILNDKRNRTYFRICSAPVSPWQYITANTLTSLSLVSLQNILILFAMKYLFRIETYVPIPVMFIILTFFGVAATGISLLITACSGSSYMASTIGTLVMTPTCMLGGCYWPVELMPEFMRKLSYFVPQRWTLEAVQKLQAGRDYGDILLNMAILAAFAAAMFILAAYRLGRKDTTQRFI